MHTTSESKSACASAAASRRSESGKSRSSRNATRRGLLANVSTLLEKPNQELDALVHKYRAEFLPSSTHEEMLVRELAVSDWRLQQNTRIETGLLSVHMHEAYSTIVNLGRPPEWPVKLSFACPQCGEVHKDETAEEPEPEPPQLTGAGDNIQTVVMGAAWANNTASLALLVRYQSQARRAYFRALKQLELVRTGKAGYLPEKPPSRMGKPIEPEAPVAENQTNPPRAAHKTAGASSSANHSHANGHAVKPQTNPIPKSNTPYIASPEEWRQIFGARDGDFDFMKSK